MPAPPRSTAAVALVFLCGRAAAHGLVNKPLSRNGLSCNEAACGPAEHHNQANAGLARGGHPGWMGQSWFTNNVQFTGNATLTSKEHHALLTTCSHGGVPPDFKDCDHSLTAGHPWRAPGTAPVDSPCGRIGGTGVLGTTLLPVPAANRSKWTAGGTAAVAWAIATNHGGGYSYRLCPASEQLTEACFQRTPLRFVGDTTDLVGLDGAVLRTISAVRTVEGTHPAGSHWTRNPIPCQEQFFPPPATGIFGPQPRDINILDRVEVPAGLAPGDYVLSWRWDCEQTPEVWNNCADVTVAAA